MYAVEGTPPKNWGGWVIGIGDTEAIFCDGTGIGERVELAAGVGTRDATYGQHDYKG